MNSVRRFLFFLSCTSTGIGMVLLLSAGTGAGLWFGVVFCALLGAAGTVGGRWGRGPVARGVSTPHMVPAWAAVLGLCVVAGLFLLWRPAVGANLPMAPFLFCLGLSALLMIPISLMGRPEH